MNSCVISPYDSENIELIEKSLKVIDENLEVSRADKTIIVKQSNNNSKDIKEKAISKAKKLANDKKEELKRVRAKNQD
jgi:ribosome recycling factor